MYKVLDVKGYEELMNKYHISSLAAKLMKARGLNFTNKIIDKNPYDYKDMDKVVGMILKAINDNEKIVIYGDYDADGICSVSILKRTFDLMNYNIGYYIPNRYEDGYGITIKKVQQFYEKGYSLIICVDNGIRTFEAVEEAKNLNMKVIVLDHHQREEKLPNFDLFLHPEYSSFTNYNMCGASVCYYVSRALLAREDEICLALAGIATLADVMPLVDQNKLIVSRAIECLNKKQYKAIDLLNTSNKKYDENLLGMQIIPKLNAVGRICKNNIANNLVKFLTSNDETEMNKLALFIDKTNEQRKKISEEGFVNLDKKQYSSKIIIEKSDDMLEGVNGIIAAKFMDKYKVPSIIFSLDETKTKYKGSGRSIKGVNIIELLEKSSCIETFGGHKGAAGVTIIKEDYDKFCSSIMEVCNNYEYKDEYIELIEVSKDELTFKAYQDLMRFSPFGEGNSKPLFILKNCDKKEFYLSKDKKHVLMNISNDASVAGFNLSNKLKEACEIYNLIFKIELNNMYSNKITCVCLDLEVNNNV